MIANLYKILFEVQLLHEYYLTDSDQSSVFDQTANYDPDDVANVASYVATRQQQGRPSVTGTVQFVVPPAMQQVFRNAGLLLVNTYSGFQVVVKATASTVNGAAGYIPAVTLPANRNLLVLLRSADGSLDAITNGRMQREIPGVYFFNNGVIGGTKVAPVLSNPIPAEVTDGSYTYQQGELANTNGAIQFAYYPAVNTTNWGDVSGDGFANESDRMIVGLRFNYTFAPTDSITTVSFVLKDSSGNTVKTINVTASTPLRVTALDFTEDAQGNPLVLNALPDAGLSEPILYTLAVTGTNYSKTFNLVFYSESADLIGCWGVIQLQTTVSDAAYSLLNGSGQLASPVFQIRCKSLPVFRQYVNSIGSPMTLVTSLDNILVATANQDQLATLLPVPLTYMPYFFVPNQWANVAGTASGTAPPAGAAAGAVKAKGTVYLPAPDPGGSMAYSNNQLSALILVPTSPLFPLPAANATSGNPPAANANASNSPAQNVPSNNT